MPDRRPGEPRVFAEAHSAQRSRTTAARALLRIFESRCLRNYFSIFARKGPVRLGAKRHRSIVASCFRQTKMPEGIGRTHSERSRAGRSKSTLSTNAPMAHAGMCPILASPFPNFVLRLGDNGEGVRNGGTFWRRWVRPRGRTRGSWDQAGAQGAPAHAAVCLWFRAGQQRARHEGAAGLPWAQQHSAHGEIHRAVAGARFKDFWRS